MIKKGFVLVLFLIAVLMVSCESENRAILEEDELLDVRYGPNPYNTMDIYLPAGRTGNTRTIILVHGGFWYSGDKEEMTEYAEYFRKQGFACIAINYRLTRTPENNVNPAQINDVGKAIDFLSVRAKDYQISSNKFGLMGVSAGGHIALLYTYASNSNDRVKSVISVAGPTNFLSTQVTNPAMVTVVQWLIGKPVTVNPYAWENASPITHVNAKSKPTFLIHGKEDLIVPYQQSTSLKTKLDANGVNNQIKLYDDLGHDIENEPEIIEEILEDSTAWFDQTLR